MDRLRRKLNRWDSNHQQIFRQFVSDAEVITLDANGRFLISRRFQKLAGITQAIRFIGMDDTIEIWSGEQTEEPFMTAEDFGRRIEEVMKDSGEEIRF